VNQAITYLAVGEIDSFGYKKDYSVLWKMLGITTTVLTTDHHQWLDKRCHWKSKYDQSDKTKKTRKKKINDKLRKASELLMKDKKKGGTCYGSNMAGPHVEGMTLDGSEVVEEIEPGKKKKGQPQKKPICHACHIVGHASNNNKDCLLMIKPLGKHCKPENAGAKCKFCTVLFVYLTIIYMPDHWYCKPLYTLWRRAFQRSRNPQKRSWRSAGGWGRQERVPTVMRKKLVKGVIGW
jgi:hypothetical protein